MLKHHFQRLVTFLPFSSSLSPLEDFTVIITFKLNLQKNTREVRNKTHARLTKLAAFLSYLLVIDDVHNSKFSARNDQMKSIKLSNEYSLNQLEEINRCNSKCQVTIPSLVIKLPVLELLRIHVSVDLEHGMTH